MEENKRRLNALLDLADIFDAKFGEARQLGYLEALKGVSVERLVWACREAAKVCEFFPVPARLIELSYSAPRPGGSPAPHQQQEEPYECDPSVVRAAMEAVMNLRLPDHLAGKRREPVCIGNLIEVKQHREV